MRSWVARASGVMTIWARRKRAAVLKSIELEKDRKGRRRERRS